MEHITAAKKAFEFLVGYRLKATEFEDFIKVNRFKYIPETIQEELDLLQTTAEVVGHDVLADIIGDLKYKDFLLSKYWQIVSKNVRRNNNNKCTICGNGGILHIHHKTYMSHGYEHIFLNRDLITLCSSCHSKYHTEKSKHDETTWRKLGKLLWE